MQTKIYSEKIEIDDNLTNDFWKNRANKIYGLQSVLLGSDKTGTAQKIRNENEKAIVEKILNNIENPRILDIGCGIGRWAENLKDKFEFYAGVDFSKGFVDYAKAKFINNSNIKFYNSSILNLDKEILSLKFNFVICTGVLMYINDKNISKILDFLKKLSSDIYIYIYIQESISTMDERMTLNNFKSEDLKAQYSAIYRTKKEYEEYFKAFNFDIKETNLLLDEKSGARKETNAQYWILRG